MPTLFDSSGAPIVLGPKLGEGGEGAVYEVPARPDLVAKIYHSAIDSLKVSKLSAMAGAATPQLLRVAAWPVNVLHASQGGRVTGLLMPRISDFREAHSLYSPKQRQNDFPKADWRFLVWTACNAARAVQTVHASGHVIGDLNQKNFMVARDATVRLIDCDSFQIAFGGRVFPCLVGVPEFTPPELQGRSFETTTRLPNHDNFGLAVLVFHFLFMGRHPFAGRYQGAGDMPPDRAIREMRFAYSQTAATKHIIPPPHSLPLSAASFNVASLFERAFGTAGVHGSRPIASEWVRGLESLQAELKTCSLYRGHTFHRSLSQCPWCAIEKAGGPDFFIAVTVSVGSPVSTFNLARTWQLVTTIAAPSAAPAQGPTLPVIAVTAKPLPSSIKSRRVSVRVFFLLAVAFSILAFAQVAGFVWWWMAVACGFVGFVLRKDPAWAAERAARRKTLDDAERTWTTQVDNWRRQITVAVDQFSATRRELDKVYAEYTSIPANAQRERDLLYKNREQIQRKAYLERYYIRTAKLSGVGNGLKTMLAAYGIDTAYDVTPYLNVGGFGPARIQTLNNWRRSIEAGFRFNPGISIEKAAFVAIEHKYARRRQELERLMTQAPQQLQRLSKRVEEVRAMPKAQVEKAARELSQARADLQAA